MQFFDWLAAERIVSATTCDAGLVSRTSPSLLIPRYIDNQTRDTIDVESWLSGVGDLLVYRRAAKQIYIPLETEG